MLTVFYVVLGVFLVSLLVLILIVLRSLIIRVYALETALIGIYDLLGKSYEFTALHSTFLNKLWGKVYESENQSETKNIN